MYRKTIVVVMLTFMIITAFVLAFYSKPVDAAGPVHIKADGGDPSSTRYPWSMFRYDLAHSGYTESPAPNTNQTQWNYPTGGALSFSSPAVVDGKVYVGSNDMNVYCLDASTGAKVWNYATGGLVDSSPAVVDNRVYIGSYDSNVYCLDASTGALVWNYTTGGWIYSSSPAVAYGRVYVGSWDHKTYCLSASTGAFIWEYATGDCVCSSPAVASNRVFIGSNDGIVYCLDASTGTQLWNYTSTLDSFWSSPAVVDNRVYIGAYLGKVYCLDASTGTHIWDYQTGSSASSSPAVAYGKVFIGCDDSKVYCLDASTGAHLWNYTTTLGRWVHSSPAVADGKVYIGSLDGKVYCLDVSTGTHIWDYQTLAGIDSSPAVADGMVFVGSNDGKLYAFGNIVRSEGYLTIQAAINNATPGATIWIAPSIYNESLVINKPLTLLGKKGSDPIFDGGGSGIAISLLSGASGSTVVGIVITRWSQGILMVDSSNCKIYDNIMSLITFTGITLQGSSAANNLVYSNVFRNNAIAIIVTASSAGNTIYNNIVTQNNVGLSLESGGNTVYHNNFVANSIHISITSSIGNTLDYGYPFGGNYWSDYTGVDFFSGPNQYIPGSDGIGDTPYVINADNQDRYPLMKLAKIGIPGDMNVDGVVDSTDLGILGSAWGSFKGDPNYVAEADINDDEVVDSSDLGIMGAHWGETE